MYVAPLELSGWIRPQPSAPPDRAPDDRHLQVRAPESSESIKLRQLPSHPHIDEGDCVQASLQPTVRNRRRKSAKKMSERTKSLANPYGMHGDEGRCREVELCK
jgi:hypothetical protein